MLLDKGFQAFGYYDKLQYLKIFFTLQIYSVFQLRKAAIELHMFLFLGKESLKRIISWKVKFIEEIFRVLSTQSPLGKEIMKKCIKTIEYSFEIMDIDSNEKYIEKLNNFFSKVGVFTF